MLDFEDGQAALAALVTWAKENDQQLARNEAQTRKDIIDRLLSECLGWPSHEIKVETHSNGEYSDYELGRPAARLLVEAKREGTYFELPAGWNSRTVLLKTVIGGDAAIQDAVEQALGYALNRGIPFAAVSNGWQIVAFLASRTDGVRPLDGRALVFSSLSELQSDFRVAWDNLSRPAIEESNLTRTLRQSGERVRAPRLAAQVPGYPVPVSRTQQQQTMQVLGGLFVEDVAALDENERRFLISCYAASGALSQFAAVSRTILQTRYSLLYDDEADFSVSPASSHVGLDPDLIGDMAAASLSRRPVILIGDVGVGKSTFIRNLIHVAAREELEHAIVFYLDLGKQPSLSSRLPEYVANEIERQLQEKYEINVISDSFVRGVYHFKLEQFRQSIYGALRESDPEAFIRHELEFLDRLLADKDQHLKSCLDHIARARKKQIVVFLDNIDQRTAEFQDELFVIGQTMAESWPVTVFLSLRPETFYRSKRKGSLSAYQPRAFSIAPPRVEIVLDKRLSYALERLQSDGLTTRSGVTISVDLTTLVQYLRAIRRSLGRGPDLMTFLENASNGNVREALGYLESYIGSAHIDLERVLRLIDQDPRYLVPVFDVVRSAMLGDYEFYDPSRSPISNVFDLQSSSRVDHFLQILLLSLLRERAEAGVRDGFVETSEVYRFAQDLGFSIDSIAFALDSAQEAQLLERAGLDRTSDTDSRAVRITRRGGYTVSVLVRSFTYLDLVIDDLPVLDRDVAGSLNPMRHGRDLTGRLNRADRVLEYLAGAWEPLRGVSGLPCEWPVIASGVRSDMTRVRASLARRRPGASR